MEMLIPQSGSQTNFSMIFNMVKGKSNSGETQLTTIETTESNLETNESKRIVNSDD